LSANDLNETAAGYSRVAAEYARQFFHELDNKPLDRQLLDRFAAETMGKGPVCDMGCGPGEVARYLKDKGADARGVDLSAGMVRQAKLLNPDIPFQHGNMLALDVPDGSWAGIAAFYSLIHIPRERIVEALRELRRVLMPGGVLLCTFHIGEGMVHTSEWWGETLSIDFNFYLPAEMESWLREAGFQTIETILRDPYPDVEHQSQRAYLFAYNGTPDASR
jgi:SAM-dependent methyltransferase